MGIIDFHCDTLMRLYDLKNEGCKAEDLWQNFGHIDLKRLKEAGYFAQFFACFLWFEGKPVRESFYEDALAMADLLHEEIKKHPEDVAFAGNYQEYCRNRKEKKVSTFLTIEEGGILDGKIERLNELHKKGIRMITLTWNYENCLGYPNKDWTYQKQGLKSFGIEALSRMDELGIVADVSHLSDEGFEDVYRYGKRPFIATHSNARSICGHSRNLTDEMIRKLAEKGGVTGLNFGGEFLQNNGESTVEAMLRQMRHIMNIGGTEVLCLGTDFDGVEDLRDIQGCAQMNKLIEGMERTGFTSNEIEGICYRNAEKFMRNYWGI